jgi:hypothetical protein
MSVMVLLIKNICGKHFITRISFLNQMQEFFFDNPTGLPDNQADFTDNRKRLQYNLIKSRNQGG